MAHPDDSALSSLKVLALCGSLRAESVNLALLHALARAAPPQIEVEVFGGLAALPLFNPDHEAEPFPAVLALRHAVGTADAVVIACPEYAHGIPGAFKNALDWLVGSAEFDQKPTLLLCASARPVHAPAQLAEVLRTMGAALLGPASAGLPSRLPDAEASLTQPEQQAQLRAWWAQLAQDSG